MDIRHHSRILWRWRAVLVGGLLAGALLAVLVTFKVSPSGIEWRSSATFTSASRTFVTQPGFPVGRATLPGANPTDLVDPNDPAARTFAPEERFSELAVVYSYLAKSDQVRKLMSPAPINEQMEVVTVPNPVTGDPLPLLEITTTANSRSGAQALNRAVIHALGKYLSENVAANKVPKDERVQLEVLNPPKSGALAGGRSITLSVIVFLLALVATTVAVYVLENLYPSGVGLRGDDDRESIDLDDLLHAVPLTPYPEEPDPEPTAVPTEERHNGQPQEGGRRQNRARGRTRGGRRNHAA
jgi:hypothetical protein